MSCAHKFEMGGTWHCKRDIVRRRDSSTSRAAVQSLSPRSLQQGPTNSGDETSSVPDLCAQHLVNQMTGLFRFRHRQREVHVPALSPRCHDAQSLQDRDMLR